MALVTVGYALLMGAWVYANPPGAAPDEPAQYVKALAAGNGQLLGTKVSTDETLAYWNRSAIAAELKHSGSLTGFGLELSRIVDIPDSDTPGAFGCTAFRPEVSGACTDTAPVSSSRALVPEFTYYGAYQPFVHVIPGLVMRFAADRYQALYLGRLAFAAMCLTLLACAVFLLLSLRDGVISLLGLFTAVTPMVIFVGSTISSSGPEICGGIAFFVALLHLARGGRHPRGAWWVAGASGVVVACSRSLSPLWIVLDCALIMGSFGVRHVMGVIAEHRRLALAMIGSVCASLAVGMGWQLAFAPHVTEHLDAILPAAVKTVGWIPDTFHQAIGIFGWLDTPLTWRVWNAVLVVVVVLLVFGFIAGSKRQRIALGGAVVVALLLEPVLYALVGVPIDAIIQGRHILPFLVAVPLLAADIIGNSQRFRGRWFAIGAVVAMLTLVGIQLVAWYSNARRYAVGGAGPLNFIPVAQWQPPVGWMWVLGMAMAGCVTLGAAVVASNTRRIVPEAARVAG